MKKLIMENNVLKEEVRKLEEKLQTFEVEISIHKKINNQLESEI